MSDVVIKAEHLSKYYHLGVINNGTFVRDIQTWWALKHGKEDPHGKIGAKKYDATKDSAAELALKIDKIILDNQYVDWIKNTDLQNKIINGIEDVLFEFKDTNKIDITFDDIDFIIDESMKIAKRRYAK